MQMKKTKQFLLIMVMNFISIIAYGQSGTPISELYLKGKYSVTCADEVIDEGSWAMCGLCNYLSNPEVKNSWTDAKNIEMNFLKDTLIITQDARITAVPYTRDPNNHSFNFTFDKELYHFRMFVIDIKKRIIENSDGRVLLLEEVK
jgi:hypothetical protein